jgi:hypothetical protein
MLRGRRLGSQELSRAAGECEKISVMGNKSVGSVQRASERFKGWGIPKQLLAVTLAIFGGLATVWGGITAVNEAVDWWQDRNEPATEFDRTPHMGLEFWQGDEEAPMFYRDDQESIRVELDGAPFVMRLPRVGGKTAVEVCAWTDDSLFGRLRPGLPADRIPCLREGRGLADQEYSSGRLYLDKEGKNYLIGTRLRPHSDQQDQAFFAKVSSRTRGEHPFADQKVPIFLILFVDRTPNRVVDHGEYESVELDF